MFQRFEKLLNPFPEYFLTTPPKTLLLFVWACTKNLRWLILFMALLTAVIGSFEDTQVLEFPAGLFSEIAPVISPTGILASINIPHLETPENQNCILLLEDIQDPGNLGSILRSASASGVDLVYLSDHCADIWSPKVLRGGQGAHFYLPCIENAVFSDITKAFKGKIFATELTGKSVFKENLKGPVAFIFGNEGNGLQSETIGLASDSIHIPMEKGIESLNVSAAVSICLYEKYRQENSNV